MGSRIPKIPGWAGAATSAVLTIGLLKLWGTQLATAAEIWTVGWGLAFLLRRCDQSYGSTTAERSVGAPGRRRVAVRPARAALGCSGVVTGLLAVWALVACGVGPDAAPIVAPPLALSLISWLGYLFNTRSTLEVSEEGVASGALSKKDRRRVPWDQIARCTIDTEANALGKPIPARCRFEDKTGRELLRVSLNGVPERERERFVAMVRTIQGAHDLRPELMAAAPPPGLGTELEASPAPAGRGTEMEGAPAPDAAGERSR